MKKIIGIFIAIIFIMVAIPQIQAVETEKEYDNNVFGLCYFKNTVPDDYGPAAKSPYMGGITILGGGDGSVTKIYTIKGEEIGSFEGRQTVFVLFMIGSHEYTGVERIFSGIALGIYVNLK